MHFCSILRRPRANRGVNQTRHVADNNLEANQFTCPKTNLHRTVHYLQDVGNASALALKPLAFSSTGAGCKMTICSRTVCRRL